MLQRSPTYLMSSSKYSPAAALARKVLPRSAAHSVARMYEAMIEAVFWFLSRKTPPFVKWLVRRVAVNNLPEGYDVDTHFKPRYNPWDQRMCLIPDADLYVAIAEGCAEVVTDRIDNFDSTGIVLTSGTHLDADVVVTATGLQLQALGGVTLAVDGAEIKPQDRFVYKAHMLEDVPNLFWCVGYTNASWTLRADITARATAKLLTYMASHGYTRACPHRGDEPMPEKPSWDIQAGYVMRSLHELPKSGTKRPWNVRQNYLADAIDYRFDRIKEAMVFGGKGTCQRDVFDTEQQRRRAAARPVAGGVDRAPEPSDSNAVPTDAWSGERASRPHRWRAIGIARHFSSSLITRRNFSPREHCCAH